MPGRHLLLVPHTHWDREWYATHEEFRYRLVRLVDRLLEILDRDPAFRCFTLDGQAIVLDDYLEVRPGERDRIAKLVRDGRLLVGPWYVLPDEWLVSGEALIRNLRIGLERAAAFGPPMRLGYAPDLFGHVGQLPQIFAGFGFEAAVVWRGVPAAVDQTLFDWEAPDGTRLPTVYLRHGYGNAVALPLEPAALRARLERDVAFLAPSSRIPTFLLMNGSDHVEAQAGLPAALEAALAGVPDTTFEIGTLVEFAARARAEAPADRPLHRGELRSGLRAPLLPGCASARIGQKRADFANDRALTAYVEPLAAWLALAGGDPGCAVLEHAWRIALQNHPHDSICGCSIDPVHDEIDIRLARVAQIARVHLESVGAELAARVAVAGDRFGTTGDALLAWNPHGTGRGAVEAALEIDLPIDRGRVRPFHLRDASGRRIPATAEVLDPGAVLADFELDAVGGGHLVAGLPADFAGARLRAVATRTVGTKLEIDLRLASAGGDLDPEAAKAELRALLAAGGFERVRVRAARVPRVRLRFADDLPAYGLRAYRAAPGRAGGTRAVRGERLAGGALRIENAAWSVEAAADGRITLLHLPTGTRIADAIGLVSEGDRGDEYNFDPVPGAEIVERPDRVRLSLAAAEGEAAIRIDARYRVPRELDPSRRARSAQRVALPVRLAIRLREGIDTIELGLEVDHGARDHRLRLRVATPFAARCQRVESAFEIAERPIAPGPDAFGPHPSERPIGTSPARRFVSADDGRLALTIANRGGGEVEVVPETSQRTQVFLTVLRAVGWLSRPDLSVRRGDAGPALPTPGAQVPGIHRLELGVRLHAVSEAGWIAEALRFAVPPLAFPGRAAPPASAPLTDGGRLLEIDDPQVLVSACEPHPAGGVRVRLWNASEETRRVRVRVPAARGDLAPVDLRDAPSSRPVVRSGDAIEMTLRPFEIATLLAS
jgi:hypothetical protein